MVYPLLAGDRDVSIGVPPQIFIGEAPIITDSAPALAAIAQWQLCVLLPTGITPYVTATHTGDALRKIVIAQLAVAIGLQCPYYTAGKFNHNLVIWPAALSTYALRKEFVEGTMIQIGHAKPPSA